MKTLSIFLAVLLSFMPGGGGAYYYAGGATATNLLLDEPGLSGATAAFALHRLRDAYAGGCLTVRRASDDAEESITWSGNELDTEFLTTFASGGDTVFVKSWQSQNGSVNWSQTVPGSQPMIVNAGTIVTGSNGLPAIEFDGVDDFMEQSTGNLDDFIANNANTIWLVFNADDVSTDAGNAWFNDGVFSDSTASFGINLKDSIGAEYWNYDGTADIAFNAIAEDTWYLLEGRHDTGNISTSLNGGSDNTVASGNTDTLSGTMTLGRNHTTEFFKGKIQCLVVYDTALGGTARTTGRNNLNAYYAIY